MPARPRGCGRWPRRRAWRERGRRWPRPWPAGGGLAAGDGDEPLHPVGDGVVEALEGRDNSRPPPPPAPPVAPMSGRAADQAARSAAEVTAGTSLAPSRYIAWTCSSGTSRSSGSLTVQALVPTIDRRRWGTTMSPSPAGCRRLTTRSHSRPTSARSTPGDGWTGTVAPAMAARRSHQGPVALTTRSAVSSASAPVRWSRSVTPVTAGRRSAARSPR